MTFTADEFVLNSFSVFFYVVEFHKLNANTMYGCLFYGCIVLYSIVWKREEEMFEIFIEYFKIIMQQVKSILCTYQCKHIPQTNA